MLRHSSNFYADGFKISTPLRCDFIQIAPVTVSLSWRRTLFESAIGKIWRSACMEKFFVTPDQVVRSAVGGAKWLNRLMEGR